MGGVDRRRSVGENTGTRVYVNSVLPKIGIEWEAHSWRTTFVIGTTLAAGLVAGLATVAMATPSEGTSDILPAGSLTAAECESGLMSWGELTYGDRVGVADDVPPEPIATVVDRWRSARGKDIGGGGVVAAQRTLDRSPTQRTVEFVNGQGSVIAQLVFNRHDGGWRLESIAECG